MRKKRKNGLAESVKKFFDDSVKNIEMIIGIALLELNIKNGIFSTHFNAFILTQVFDAIRISRLFFEKHEFLMLYTCCIVTKYRRG